MSATQDIVATYRAPGKVVRRLIGQGTREDRALVFLMLACVIVFVAQTPRLARQAHTTGEELGMLMGATLLAWVFIAPLVLYLVAGLTQIIAKVFGFNAGGYGARLSLFWALLASSPVLLLHGLTAGFVGPGIELNLVGILWIAVFFWFWIAGFIAAGRASA